MLIVLYFFFINILVPQVVAYLLALLEPLMVIVITMAGIVMLFGAVGMKISNNLGSTIMNGLFRGIGYIFNSLFRAIAWIVRSTFRLLPRVFNESRRAFMQIGLNALVSNLLAVIVAIIFVIIII